MLFPSLKSVAFNRPPMAKRRVKQKRSLAGLSMETLEARQMLSITNVTAETLMPSESQAFTGTVATFSGTPGDNFSATIDWGDGHTSAGSVGTVSAGNYTISGTNTYAEDGLRRFSVLISDTSDSTTGADTGTAIVQENAFELTAGPTISTTEGMALTGFQAATFQDPGSPDPASDFSATIDWGDGTITSGTVIGSAGSFIVTGDHTYSDELSASYSVTVSEPDVDFTFGPIGSAVTVAEADLSLSPAPTAVGFTEGTASSGVFAIISDPGSSDLASSFSANIAWGDGTVSSGTLTGSAGSYTVSGSHAYADEGIYTVTVTASENDAVPAATATATATFTVSVAEGDFGNLISATITPTEGQAFSGAVASFTDEGNPLQVAGDWTASIDWGDGTSITAGTVTGPTGGPFTISGNHTYADEGTFTVVATFSDDPPSALTDTPITSTALVSDADALTAPTAAVSVNAIEGMTFSSAALATFTNSFTGSVAADFSATIDWGDGTQTAGIVTGGGGTFAVGGSHLYLDEMPATPISVVLSENAPGTASATAVGTVTVQDAPLTATNISLTATAGIAFTATVASFTDANPNATLADFSAVSAATINWGDGTSSVGTVVAGGSTFNVIGTHTYLAAGTPAITVHIADEGGSSADATSTAGVTALVDLTVTKSDNHGGNSTTSTSGSVVAGTGLTYTIVISNAGPSEAFDATITDSAPLGFQVLSSTPTLSGGAVITASSGTGGSISDTVNLPSGSSITYVVTGTLASSASDLLSNTVDVGVAAGTVNSGDTTATDIDQITTGGPLAGVPGDGTIRTFVHNLYRELLGREADAAGNSFWVGYLTAHNNAAGRQTVVEAFLNSAEYKAHYITTLYQVFLGRSPEPAALQFWTSQMGQPGTPGLHNGPADESNILAQIVGSDEFYAKAGGTPETFVRAVYRDLLDWPGDAAGVAGWVAILNAQPQHRDLIVRSFLNSPELEHKLLNRFYPAQGGTAANPLSAPGSSAAAGAYDLAVITGNGWENLYLEGAALLASPGGGDAYFNELARGASWDDVQLQMLSSSQFYNNPLRPTTT